MGRDRERTRHRVARASSICHEVACAPDGCDADDDNDGVPDGADRCPGTDDRVDADGDGTPDGCDDIVDTTKPIVIVTSASLTGGTLTVAAASTDPESAVVSISVYASIGWTCTNGNLASQSGPGLVGAHFATANGAQITESEQYTFGCPAGWSLLSARGTVWASATNEAGLTGERAR